MTNCDSLTQVNKVPHLVSITIECQLRSEFFMDNFKQRIQGKLGIGSFFYDGSINLSEEKIDKDHSLLIRSTYGDFKTDLVDVDFIYPTILVTGDEHDLEFEPKGNARIVYCGGKDWVESPKYVKSICLAIYELFNIPERDYYPLIKLDTIPLKREQELNKVNKCCMAEKIDMRICCVSYRWLTPDHPDPHGTQMKLIPQDLIESCYFFIDYSCLPQKPRTVFEEVDFKSKLNCMSSFYRSCDHLVRLTGEDYYKRTWCLFETYCASLCLFNNMITTIGPGSDIQELINRMEDIIKRKSHQFDKMPTEQVAREIDSMRKQLIGQSTCTNGSDVGIIGDLFSRMLNELIIDKSFYKKPYNSELGRILFNSNIRINGLN